MLYIEHEARAQFQEPAGNEKNWSTPHHKNYKISLAKAKQAKWPYCKKN
jgi:hypothetical protein